MKTVRWGIIGCGDVTEIKSGPALNKAKDSELVAVMRRQGNLAKDYAQRHGVPIWYDVADSLINDAEVNAVYIATPPSTHKQYTLMAAKAGKPVYVEKPMAMNYDECRQMTNACKEAGVPLYVAYYRRALPRFLKVKELISSGAIGNIRHVSINLAKKSFAKDITGDRHWRTDPNIGGCGYFCDLAPHILDILQFYFGPIVTAGGAHRNNRQLYQAEDIVTAEFQFENGIIGTGNWLFNHFEDIDETRITGTEGKITFATFDDHTTKLLRDKHIQEFNIENPRHIQQPLIQNIVNELLGKDKSPSTGETAALTNRAMDWILA